MGSKATSEFNAQQKVVDAAKKKLIADSDKLSRAKNDKMPSSAIKELSAVSASSKDAFKAEEAKLSKISKSLSTAAGNEKKQKQTLNRQLRRLKQQPKKRRVLKN